MVVGIDARVLVLGRRSGVEEYLLQLLPPMLANDPDVEFRLFYSAWRKEPLAYPWLRRPNVRVFEFRFPNRFFLFPANVALGIPRLDRLLGGCDVFWSPHIFFAALSSGVRQVLTVHDLAFERYPEHFSLGKRFWHRYLMRPRRQARRADQIVAVSRSTQRDLERLYGVPSSKISVIYPGVDLSCRVAEVGEERRRALRKKYRLPERFILFFGTLEPRKNVGGLIAAFELYKQTYAPAGDGVRLVIAGSPGWLWRDVIRRAQRSALASDIVFTGFVAEEDKPFLYRLAEVFAYPSFFEGFGFPPLEAMACGIPVITSNRSSLPEVVGDAAILIDPYRPMEVAQALAVLLHDQAARRMLVARGLERAARFSWETAARQLMTVLRDQPLLGS